MRPLTTKADRLAASCSPVVCTETLDCANSIRKRLLSEFPCAKYTIALSPLGVITIKWTDATSWDALNAICDRFEHCGLYVCRWLY